MKNKELEKIILDIFHGLEGNSFKTLGFPEEPIWDEPIVGIAAGTDPYYDFLKEHIGPFHWSPAEAFAFRNEGAVNAENLKVVSIIFPQTMNTKNMQKEATVFPSDRWVVSRGEWEPLMREFSPKFEKALAEKGIRSSSIDLIPEFSRMESEKQGIASKWSHRHSAFAAGHGTFGLSDGFISRKGIAIRITSIIVEDAELEVTPRTYEDPYEWCTKCGACIPRCPVQAIDEDGHKKPICAAYADEAIEKYWPSHIERGEYIFGCGLCQVKVPCQNKRP